MAPLHLATKFQLRPVVRAPRIWPFRCCDLPTGNKDSGIASGSTAFGAGLHYTASQFTFGGFVHGRRDRSAKNSNFPFLAPDSSKLPNELLVEAGWNHPIHFWRTTNWISDSQHRRLHRRRCEGLRRRLRRDRSAPLDWRQRLGDQRRRPLERRKV